jgi:preprotein translocase subunit SecA
MMGRLGIPENQPIENRMVSSAIEAAQSKIEGFNFDTRKHLLDYDDVMNHQRKIIYERRRKILFSDNNYLLEELGKIIEEAELKKKQEEVGEENFFKTVRFLMLQIIDMFWVDHLEMMDYMRSSVNLRAYGQRDPLVEYKNEGLRMFRQMEESIKRTLAEMVLRMGVQPIVRKENQSFQPVAGATRNKAQVGRNDPCPCGSGKKYKKCHGK